MKKFFILGLGIIALAAVLQACAPAPTSSDIQRRSQEQSLKEAVAQTGLPAITNFREYKLAKDIYEMRDQTGLITYTYLENMIPTVVPGSTALGGKLTYVCVSVGYPLPYATQFTAPVSVQTYNLEGEATGGQVYYGAEILPQAEPNGLFSPSSAEGTWVLCADPNGGDTTTPVYLEPKVIVSQFKFPVDN